MFFTPGTSFNWRTDNFGATLTNAAFGTAVTANALANTKGSDVTLIAGSSVTEDVYGIAIVFAGGSLAAATRNFLADLRIDPAGGTSWTTIIDNLLVRSPNFICGGYCYYFPLYLDAGTSIGMRQQCSTGSTSLRAGVRLFGKPTRPELLRFGTKVETYGAAAASSAGTSMTPGNAAQGSYTASLGTIAGVDKWWWQAGMGMNDTTGSENSYFLDVALGDATNKRLAMEYLRVNADENEQCGKGALPMFPPFCPGVIGDNVYMRGWAAATPDSSITVAAYGLG